MQRKKEKPALPQCFAKLLEKPDCRKYLRFSENRLFVCQSLTRTGEKGLVLALEEEHTDLGRELVEALWFECQAEVILEADKEKAAAAIWVYRCHIAGPLFQEKLLETRRENPEKDMASAWELYVTGEADAMSCDLAEAREPGRAKKPEWHLDHPGLHR